MLKYTFIFFFIISNLTFGQVSKDQTESYIKKFRKELKKKNVEEFFVVKHIQYGTVKLFHINDKDYCEKDGVHYRMYAFWKEDNDYWLKVFDNCGGFIPMKLENKKAFDFYVENFEKIKLDEVEIYKLKADSIENGKKYSYVSTQSHSPLRYFWFYKGSVKFKKYFDKYNLTSDEKSPNLNYELNNNLELVELNRICDVLIEESVKTENLVREK